MRYINIMLLLMLLSSLSSLTLQIENENLQIYRNNDSVELSLQRSTVFSNNSGAPAIPIQSFFFTLPSDKEPDEVELIPHNISNIQLNENVVPIQQPYPLSYTGVVNRMEPNTYYNQSSWLYDYGSYLCGSERIGYISWFSATYNSENNILNIPHNFTVQMNLKSSNNPSILSQNYVTSTIMNKLNLKSDDSLEPVYMVIYPQNYQSLVESLLNWRYQQGIDVYSISLEEIIDQYEGLDVQMQLRNAIIDYFMLYQVSHVTLVGDVDMIPHRKLFAFDCQFGAYEDENEIPGDIYYSCLNGNWDANQNGIYGEQSDECDFIPEVFVSRIPVNNPEQLSGYLDMMFTYEKGLFPNLNKAGGFSMELWDGSNSYQCQQFIYDSYFPDDYQIDFIYGDDNNSENAYNIINANQNIIQHTGHAGKTVLSLEEGWIRNTNLDNLANDWGGLFYSIGCWSAALDYDSIGENLVTWPDHGFLGYIGNSRYGWGAPAAPGFGFSEFYQKEFMQLVFTQESPNLAELNALQKIPFVPYWNGTSVYKWCGYQLNALGDSFFRILTHDPKNLSVNAVWNDTDLILDFSSEDLPVEDVTVTCGVTQVTSDYSGKAIIEDCNAQSITIYKYGYKFIKFDLDQIQSQPYISNVNNLDIDGYLKGSETVISFDLTNPTDEFYDVTIDYEADEDLVELSWQESNVSIAPQSTTNLSDLNIRFKDDQQLPDGFKIPLTLNISDADELNIQYHALLKIKAPVLEITDFSYNSGTLNFLEENPFRFTVVNNGNVTLYNVEIQYISDELFFEEHEYSYENVFMPRDTIMFQNSWSLESESEEAVPFSIILSTYVGEQRYDYYFEYLAVNGVVAINESFEDDLLWPNDGYWQSVDIFQLDGDHSLSCRPDVPGNYELRIPACRMLDGAFVDFMYRYKMPMYGKDGIYLILEQNSKSDTLLFLGAGGALLDSERDPQVYIENDWQHYVLDIKENTSLDLVDGDYFNLIFRFVYDEEIVGFNQYGLMDDIGIFIDQLIMGQEIDLWQPHESDDIEIDLYPNPLHGFQWMTFDLNLKNPDPVKIEIYNIKGQKIDTIKRIDTNIGQNLLFWKKADSYSSSVASGIYLIKIKIANRTFYRKVALIK